MSDQINRDDSNDGIDRRGVVECMTWAGTGAVRGARSGGVLTSRAFGDPAPATEPSATFSFVQISDSHVGFAKDPNKDVIATFQRAVDKINALPRRPDVLL